MEEGCAIAALRHVLLYFSSAVYQMILFPLLIPHAASLLSLLVQDARRNLNHKPTLNNAALFIADLMLES